MRNVITDSVVLPAAAERLFGMYLDPALHAAFTGFPVTIAAVPGAKFEAFEGQLSGQILHVVESRLIVQSWRSTQFNDEDPDSTLILSFIPQGDQGGIELVHLDVPDHDFEGVMQGWSQYYWKPWSAWLTRH